MMWPPHACGVDHWCYEQRTRFVWCGAWLISNRHMYTADTSMCAASSLGELVWLQWSFWVSPYNSDNCLSPCAYLHYIKQPKPIFLPLVCLGSSSITLPRTRGNIWLLTQWWELYAALGIWMRFTPLPLEAVKSSHTTVVSTQFRSFYKVSR